uniref:Uncharacterized protein n=1 Tax=Setaria italica TaxID=4555 RepID=K3XP42_SETIT
MGKCLRPGDWSLNQGVYYVGELQELDGSSLQSRSGIEGRALYQGSSYAEDAFRPNLRDRRL